MIGFERKGCELQMACETVHQAIKTFEYSCNVCCTRGVRLTCERCAIAATHENVVAAIRDFEEEKRLKEVERAKAQKAMAG